MFLNVCVLEAIVSLLLHGSSISKFAFNIPSQLHKVKYQNIYVLVSKISHDNLKPEGYH